MSWRKAGDQDGGQVAARLLRRLLHAVQVVEGEGQQVRPVLGRDASDGGRAPGHRAVVGAARDQHLAAPGPGPRDGDAGRGGVGAVLAEDAPIRMRHQVDHQLGQLHQHGGRPVHAVAAFGLVPRRLLHQGMVVAEHDGTPGAHQVDEAAPVHVLQPAALGAGEELRVALRQLGRVQVAPLAPGNHAPGPLPQSGVPGVGAVRRGRALGRDGIHGSVLHGRRVGSVSCRGCRRPPGSAATPAAASGRGVGRDTGTAATSPSAAGRPPRRNAPASGRAACGRCRTGGPAPAGGRRS